jgi:hypothetical protein
VPLVRLVVAADDDRLAKGFVAREEFQCGVLVGDVEDVGAEALESHGDRDAEAVDLHGTTSTLNTR